jgi:hypothetical protein
MSRYQMYTSLEDQQIELPKIDAHSEINDITERSTPNEMANFITEKLMEVVERELGLKKGLQLQE